MFSLWGEDGIKPQMMDISGVTEGAAGWCSGSEGSGGDGELPGVKREQGSRPSATSPPAKPNALPVPVPGFRTAWISPWPSRLRL